MEEEIHLSTPWRLIVLAAFILFLVPAATHAASLFFSPSSGTPGLQKTFTVGVYAESAQQAMNAASGTVSFPSGSLEVVSLSRTGSVLNLWVQDPTYSNVSGTVNFEGVVLNPGYTGKAGKILDITFRTKAAGEIPVQFSSSAILANDGKGTNILKSVGRAMYEVEVQSAPKPAPVEAPTPEAPKKEEPAVPPKPVTITDVPQVFSDSHPQSAQWYADNTPSFRWDLPAGITAVRTQVTRDAKTRPTIEREGAMASRDVEALEDGIWYFHLQLRDAAGWGPVAHYQFQIDTQKPDAFRLLPKPSKDATDPHVVIELEASDALSGISHFEIQADGGDWITWEDDSTHRYLTEVLRPGQHMLIAKAVDHAGNFAADSVEVVVEALETPTITRYPRTLQSGSFLEVAGQTAYPGTQVIFSLQRGRDEVKKQLVSVGDDGAFLFASDRELEDGTYKFWAEVVDTRGARSQPTAGYLVSVRRPAFIVIGTLAIDYLAVIVPLLLLVLALLGVLWTAWRRVVRLRERVEKKAERYEGELLDAIVLIKKDIYREMQTLKRAGKRRELTAEEQKILKRLRSDVDLAENLVKRSFEDIEKEVEG